MSVQYESTAQFRKQVGWELRWQWVLANGVGWAVGSIPLWFIAKIPFIALVSILLSFGVGWAIIFGAISGRHLDLYNASSCIDEDIQFIAGC